MTKTINLRTIKLEIIRSIKGDAFFDDVSRLIYATDASSYREIPIGVAYPKDEADVQTLVQLANKHHFSLIPRTAGTSLAGQVVGGGLIVDVSRYMMEIIEYNEQEKWVRLQPGVVRDVLNAYLKPNGVLFGPETSTANRAMIGGMVGNNSCGSNSIVYGTTRDHLIEVKGILSDGSPVVFGPLTTEDFKTKKKNDGLEGRLYRQIDELLSDQDNRNAIDKSYPDRRLNRRNTGYAIDVLMHTDPFEPGNPQFNFCKIIAGSEGTLVFITEVKVSVKPLPPTRQALICGHFDSIYKSLKAAQIALKYKPVAVELMDHYILDATRNNLLYRSNMFFVQGEPKAILVIALSDHEDEVIQSRADKLIAELRNQELGFHYPVVWNEDATKVWDLRKAGLGLLSNMPGDAKPVPVIEDTAVSIDVLPEYIEEFNAILDKHKLKCVHYAHAGAGELHLRPILNLKTAEGNLMFRTIAEEICVLVKKYNGSLSGEHGDGRLRGEFIASIIGDKNYAHLKAIKNIWDPHNIFNPGKIVDTPSMNTQLRFNPGQDTPNYETRLDFSSNLGIVRAAEQCNGSADCRKTELSGGTMCPSYMATHDEKHTTRARANIFREIAGRENSDDPFTSKQILDVMDLCLSCKGCKSECPSNVDIAKIKTEFLYQYHKKKGKSLRTTLIGNFTRLNNMISGMPWLYNLTVTKGLLGNIMKRIIGFAVARSMPELNKQTFVRWFYKNEPDNFGIKPTEEKNGDVWLFVDEFTNFNDLDVGKAVVFVLTGLGYHVKVTGIHESGRSMISKGMLDEAKVIADRHMIDLKNKINDQKPLIGIEPSALLSFRDEYPELADDKETARRISPNAFLFEEFLSREVDKGKVTSDRFHAVAKEIKYHGHCHQKALSSVTPIKKILDLIPEATVIQIPSGCCGMAGSFGYEKEHYDVSMKIGELVLFPAVRKMKGEGIVVAPGTSCRHQIKDGTGVKSYHPAEVLWQAMK